MIQRRHWPIAVQHAKRKKNATPRSWHPFIGTTSSIMPRSIMQTISLPFTVCSTIHPAHLFPMPQRVFQNVMEIHPVPVKAEKRHAERLAQTHGRASNISASQVVPRTLPRFPRLCAALTCGFMKKVKKAVASGRRTTVIDRTSSPTRMSASVSAGHPISFRRIWALHHPKSPH